MRKAFLQLHLAVFLAGFTAILGKLIQVNEVMLVIYRMIIAIPVLYLLLAKSKDALANKKWLIQAMGVGAIIGFHWVTFYASIKYAGVSVALVCFAATSCFTAILEPIIEKVKFDYREVLLGLMSLFGIYIVFNFHGHYQKGMIFGLLAALGSALFPIFNKRLLRQVVPLQLTTFNMWGCLIVVGILAPFYLHFFPDGPILPTNRDVLWLVILSIACTILPFLLQLNALQRVSAFTVNITYNLEPFYGIALAMIIFKEYKDLNTAFFVGMSLVMLSLIIQMFRIRKKSIQSGS